MSWASSYIEKLKNGQIIQFRPRGLSMQPKIESGQLVTVKPTPFPYEFKKGDIVLCRCRGRDYLHLIKAIKKDQYQIGNNKGHINGWVTAHSIYGIVTNISP